MSYVLTNKDGHEVIFDDQGRNVWVFSTRKDTGERVHMKMPKAQARKVWREQIAQGYKRTK